MALTKSSPLSGAVSRQSAPPGQAEPFSHSPSLAGQEAELTGGYEREIAAEQDREREEYLGWR